MSTDLRDLLLEQIDWHWREQARPRLQGLTDEEYLWQPVADCWTVRPRGDAGPELPGAMTAGTGDWVIDWAMPEPAPAPVTTIAWRLGHVIVGVLGMRNAIHFGAPQLDYESFPYAGTAEGALTQLDEQYARWMDGVRGWDDDALGQPIGPAEGQWGDAPRAALVLHINRELIHHMAEIALLRDLYEHRG